jgi:hypothetical protein
MRDRANRARNDRQERFQASGSGENALDLIRRRYSVVEFDFLSKAAFS